MNDNLVVPNVAYFLGMRERDYAFAEDEKCSSGVVKDISQRGKM